MINQRTAAELTASPAGPVIESGVRAGFLTQHEMSVYDLHPLLRAFLLEKFEALDSSLQDQPVGRAFKILVRSAAWEEAFGLIDRFHKHDLIEQLVTAALEGLVQQGRVETLRQWIQTAEANDFKSPVFDLLEAECAFRQGLHGRARALALRAGDALDPNSPLASKAFYRAGQNAHLTDSPRDAIESFHRARELAQTSADARNAIWGAFITNVELERPEAKNFLMSSLWRARDRLTTYCESTTAGFSWGLVRPTRRSDLPCPAHDDTRTRCGGSDRSDFLLAHSCGCI